MEQRKTFNKAAKTYDVTRPSYPDEVIDWILERTNPSKGKEILEIGAGTGQATLKFAQRGYRLRCVELGEELAKILRQKGEKYGVKVEVSSFEDWAPQDNFKTPLVFSATAFHWIDPNVRYKKCHEFLEEDGYLVLIWNVAPDSEFKQVQKAYELLFGYYPEKRDKPRPNIDEIKESRKSDIINNEYFELEDYLDYEWNFITPREQFTEEFFSQSSYLALSDEKQRQLAEKIKELYSSLDEMVATQIHTTVYIAKRRKIDESC